MLSIAINLLLKIEDHTFGLHSLPDSRYPRLLYLQYVKIGMIDTWKERIQALHLFIPLSLKNKFSLFIKACRTSLFWLILGKNEKLISNAKGRKQ